jgi:hypothetical protein
MGPKLSQKIIISNLGPEIDGKLREGVQFARP